VTHLCFIDQIKKMETIPDTNAHWGTNASTGFKDRSSQPAFSSRPNVPTQDNFRELLNTSRNTFTLNFRATMEKDTERDRLKKHRLISGLGLAGSWVATVIVDFLYEDGYRGYTLIPVIGPFITIATIEHRHEGYWPGAQGLLILSGIAQSALAAYFVISLVRHPKPSETKNVTLWPSLNSMNLRIQF
jgi:hypothetical protein